MIWSHFFFKFIYFINFFNISLIVLHVLYFYAFLPKAILHIKSKSLK